MPSFCKRITPAANSRMSRGDAGEGTWRLTKKLTRTASWLGLVGIAPLLINLASWYFAKSVGCLIHEGSIMPCPIGGTDIGEVLHYGGIIGFAFAFTWPAAAASLVLYIAALLLWLRRRPRTKAETPGSQDKTSS